MQIDFKGKTIVITGGSGGLGRRVTECFLDLGAQVAVIERQQKKLDQLTAELSAGGAIRGYALDLEHVNEIAAVVARIKSEMGEITGLVQCAGRMSGTPGLDITSAEWDALQNVNARATFFMMQQVVSQSMQYSGGSIVNISSMAGIRGMHEPLCSASYSASKGAVNAITMQAAVEWATLGVRVNAIAPGGVKTPAMQANGIPKELTDPIPLGHLARPEDIAHAAVFLCSDMAAMITGQILVVDGGASVVGY